MNIIKREMEVTEKETNGTGNSCQASFNSDGVITLRNYNTYDKNNDEIIILSREETQAIIELFRQFNKFKGIDLPF